mgnify:FL=1
MVAALAPAIEGMVERFTAFLQRSIEAKGGVEAFARALAIDLLRGVKSALSAFQELANGFITVYNGALEAKDALTQVFTPDSKKNARQLRKEIDELGKLLSSRAKRIEGETAKQKRSSELRQASDFKTLMGLQALLIQADETGNGLDRITKVDFATRINAEIDAMVGNLENVKTNIVDLPKVIVPAIGDMEQAFTAWRDTIPDLDVSIKALTTQGLNGLTDALTAGVTGAANFADAIKSMAKSVVDSLIKMLIQKYIVDAAFGFITNKISGSLTTGSSNMQGNLDATNAALSFNGGGFTGMGSRSGGVDGKGGFPAILHPNETVTDHTKGQSSGGVVVNQTINVTTGVQQTVRAEIVQLMPQIAQAAKGAVADARLRGGNFSKAMGGA